MEKKISVIFTKITIIRKNNCPDKICPQFRGTNPYPFDGSPNLESPYFTIETSPQFAEKWLESFGISPEMISVEKA